MSAYEDDIANYIRSLIERGTKIMIFQEFVGTMQEFKTIFVCKNGGIVIFHERPLPFSIQTSQQIVRIIEDAELPRPTNRYRPS